MTLTTILAAGKSGLDNFCSQANFLKALKIVSTLIVIIKIIAPAILIITGMITLGKVVISGEETMDAVKSLITRFFIAVFIFFVPTIVYTIMGVVDGYNRNAGKYANCISCLKKPSNCGVSSLGH